MSGQRFTVYLLHGLLTTSNYHFAPQLALWKRDLAVVPVDFPGHGRCGLDAGVPYLAGAVEYTLAVMDRFGPGHVVAASYLGCPVAVRCALRRPDLVRSLALTGFAPDIPAGIFAAWLESFGRLAATNGALAAWYRDMHGARWSATLAAYEEDVRLRYAVDVAVTRPLLATVARPTLIVNGSQKSNEREASLAAATVGPVVRGQVIEGAGHAPGRDRPAELDSVLRAYWKECSVAQAVAV